MDTNTSHHAMSTHKVEKSTEETQAAASQPVIVLTDCSAPYRIIGVSANWVEHFGTSTPEVVGRSMKVLFGPQTDNKSFTSVLKHANLSISTAVSTFLYGQDGVAMEYTVFGKESDAISPRACELFLYPAEELKLALTSNTKLVVCAEEPYIIKSEWSTHLRTSCIDVVGRPLLDVYASCGLDVTQLRKILETAAEKGCSSHGTIWGDMDLRASVKAAPDSAGLILVELTRSRRRSFELGNNTASIVSNDTYFPPSRLPSTVPEQLHVLLQEGGGFPPESSGVLHFLRVSLGGCKIESKERYNCSPLWNEMHALRMLQLPATVVVEAVTVSNTNVETVIGVAEVALTEQVIHGYSDDWIQLDLQGLRRSRCRVRLAFSCVQRHLDQIKHGLFPSGAQKFSIKA